MTILVSTWQDGVFAITGESRRQELAGRPVRWLAPGPAGSTLAVVDGDRLCQRSPEGEWSPIVTLDASLACHVTVGSTIYIGTDDARVFRVVDGGPPEQLTGFDNTPGRDGWYAGSAVVNGRVVGPPLGVRSMAATAGGEGLLANVHVGGVPRSVDAGATWQPTIDVDADVHEVVAHPARPGTLIAAAATGFCLSTDGGATWTVEQDGLHATYCSAVAFLGDDALVAASSDHFAECGAIYRRSGAGSNSGALEPVGAGIPSQTQGIVDTGCIATSSATLAVADQGGNLYVSVEGGLLYSASGLPSPSSVLVV